MNKLLNRIRMTPTSEDVGNVIEFRRRWRIKHSHPMLEVNVPGRIKLMLRDPDLKWIRIK